MKLEADFTKECVILFEHKLAYNDISYLVIYGIHINGAFICIPNHFISCEATDIENNQEYNTERLIKAGLNEKPAAAIANYINEWLIANEEEIKRDREARFDRLQETLRNLKK